MKVDPYWMMKEVPRLVLSSEDLQDDGIMPNAQISARIGGQDISPHLKWSAVPEGAKSFNRSLNSGIWLELVLVRQCETPASRTFGTVRRVS